MELSRRIDNIQPSATLTITSKAKAMKMAGEDVVGFGAGEPDFDTPDYIKESAIAAIRGGSTKYTPSIGIPELREVISISQKERNGLDYKPENIVVSSGAKHTLYNIFQAICQDGDEVIIPAPYWVSYPEMVKLSGADPVIVHTRANNAFKMSASDLSKALTGKTKALILNSPSNPTGSVYTRGELRAIHEVVSERDIWVISDEIYDRLIYGDKRHVSFASLNKRAKEMALVVNGVSKTYSMTGWRIGYLATENTDLAAALKRLQDHSTSNPCSISQHAALAAIRDEDDSVSSMRKEFQKRRDYMMERLNGISEFSYLRPEGAFYCFVDVSRISSDTLDFAQGLLDEAKVAVIPGEAFGAAGNIRLSFATGMEKIKQGLDRIEKWVKQ